MNTKRLKQQQQQQHRHTIVGKAKMIVYGVAIILNMLHGKLNVITSRSWWCCVVFFERTRWKRHDMCVEREKRTRKGDDDDDGGGGEHRANKFRCASLYFIQKHFDINNKWREAKNLSRAARNTLILRAPLQSIQLNYTTQMETIHFCAMLMSVP